MQHLPAFGETVVIRPLPGKQIPEEHQIRTSPPSGYPGLVGLTGGRSGVYYVPAAGVERIWSTHWLTMLQHGGIEFPRVVLPVSAEQHSAITDKLGAPPKAVYRHFNWLEVHTSDKVHVVDHTHEHAVDIHAAMGIKVYVPPEHPADKKALGAVVAPLVDEKGGSVSPPAGDLAHDLAHPSGILPPPQGNAEMLPPAIPGDNTPKVAPASDGPRVQANDSGPPLRVGDPPRTATLTVSPDEVK